MGHHQGSGRRRDGGVRAAAVDRHRQSSVVEVAHAPKAAANSADDEIVRLVRSGAQPQEIRVVTSDKALTDRVRDLGAAVYPAERFRDLIDPRGSNAARRTQ
ncbi:hypothetical protein J113_13625 [Mycobacterium tuberculosis CAS/NITR204]|uniref:YacP-like NYN domain protein n=1 Tax=Mycobacterium tuberculosis CAS/NITR204 TaxID=1310114 RepID=R4MEP7_MYCTX|nr:hypothetical protein J113_13625 [Mycobacterium tuberculosis CAS/NITR204]